MDWDKAKKIIIFVLIMLNMVLCGLNYKKAEMYKLSPSQEKAVYEVMANNGIILYSSVINKFMPMRQITVKIPELSIDELKSVFFDSNEETNVVVEFNRNILKSEKKAVTIQDNTVLYECDYGTGFIKNFSEEKAKSAAKNFMLSLGSNFSQFKLDNVTRFNNEYMFEYYEEHNGSKIFSSYSKITVSEKGVTKMETTFYDTKSFSGQKREICSCDEALLTLMYSLKEKGITKNIFINKIEIGYDFQDKSEIEEGSKLKLVPCYRFYIEDLENPITINAYTNEIKE